MPNLPENVGVLPRSFYLPPADVVAPRLLGHWLIRRAPEGLCGGLIVETEAYLHNDPACHAAVGETERNRVMFGGEGHAYVYFIYGCHFCVNAVCQPRGIAEAVLIRALEPAFGEDLMLRRRPVKHRRFLTDGPGKLCAALGISRELDGADLCDPSGELFIAANPGVAALLERCGPIVTTERIGISKAKALPLRFYLHGSAAVSRKSSDPPSPRLRRTGPGG